jgi:nitrate/TMAO reductase-like tetraheme cytochrome c subunit
MTNNDNRRIEAAQKKWVRAMATESVSRRKCYANTTMTVDC